ncbi:TorF family putative porin [Oceanobacter sp. 3_MG-2023]|uniref:TorF family putative porin n=1 Tax=Oceanobacter sp. 3_MG-2023 TaxID=3062622 RepID=UPI0027354E1E|nr:TorF family putative porin [Oceanobacter sp. 3_MG-2023]MDP2506901.1 TorF family putative porin [Oceanobacter sp. 3_MG-2023]
MKKLSQAIVLAGAMTAGLTAVQTAQAEISASVDLASMYLWHGQDLGGGAPVVSGSLDYSHESGLYAGVWTSSGDTSLGTETDLYIGYAGAVGDLGYDIGYATYLYPETDEYDQFDDSANFSLGFSYSMASIRFDKSSDSDADGFYFVVGADIPDTSFSASLGGEVDKGNDFMHLDVTYAYNDTVAFTISKILDQDIEMNEAGHIDESAKYVVSYSLPIEM